MFFKNIEVSGIRRIVIRRQIVWERELSCDDLPVWRKTAGGPGFDATEAAGTRRATKTPEEMKRIVDKLLEKYVTTGRWQGQDVVGEQYRAWVHGDTLNIVEIRRGEKKITVRREVR